MKTALKSPPKRKAEPSLTPQTDLIYQTLETEIGGVAVYTAALTCAQNEDLRKEWKKYLKQTKHHVEVMGKVCDQLGLDPARETPGRQAVRLIGTSLVKAMQLALKAGNLKAAELVAAECVTLAETKDHSNWVLLGKLAEHSSGTLQKALRWAHDKVEDEEDEHLYHTSGWARELWLEALGLPAQVPPPEEEQDVHSEAEALQAKKESEAKRS